MFIPLGTDRPLRRPTLATFVLIGINVVVFAVQLVLKAGDEDAFATFMQATQLSPLAIKPWTFFTYQFVHAYERGLFILHIAGNMLFLWVFGPNVEDRLGRIGFVALYLVGGAAAGGVHALFVPNPVIGASGSIAAITGAYLVLFPRTHVKTLLFFFVIGIFMIPAPWYIGFQVVWDILQTGFHKGSGVATLAHLGGYAFGFGVAMALLGLKAIPREPYDLFSIGKQVHRRRQFREAGAATRRARETGAGVHRGVKEREKSQDELPQDVQEARVKLAHLVSAGDFAGASAAYRELLDSHHVKAGVVGRRTLLELCKGLFTIGDHEVGAVACGRFIEAYPNDDEAPSLKLMLGLIKARYLNDPVAAKQLVREAQGEVRTSEERELAGVLLEELG